MGSLTHLCDGTRSDWNARAPLGALRAVSVSQRTEFFSHYIGDGSPNFAGRPHSDCLKQIRQWQHDHQHKPPPKGPWKDIGYNALVCGHARLVEGRGLDCASSHCPGHNRTGFGVQFMVAGSENRRPRCSPGCGSSTTTSCASRAAPSPSAATETASPRTAPETSSTAGSWTGCPPPQRWWGSSPSRPRRTTT